MPLNSVVYLLCEAKSRDLDSRLLVAAHLLKAGCIVVLGQQWSIAANKSTMMKGCVLFNTANFIQGREMGWFRDHGHFIVATDTEGTPFAGDGFLVNIDPTAMTHAHVFLAHSDVQHRVLQQRYPALAVQTTGSARIDLLRAAKPARPIPEPYILFNTNFAMTNSIWGDVHTAVKKLIMGGGLDPKSEAGRTELQTRLDFEVATRNETIPLIKWCTENLDILTVIRPHPAEDPAPWTAIQGKNIRVVANSSPLPWIANAKVAIHANSTTGLEAALLGTPCLNISPTKYEAWVSQFLMNKVNRTVSDYHAAVSAISAFMKTSRGLDSDIAAAGFAPEGGPRTAQAIVDLLNAHGAVPPGGDFPWVQHAREDVARAKFSVTKEEMANGIAHAARNLAMPKLQMVELDDSLVLLQRQV